MMTEGEIKALVKYLRNPWGEADNVERGPLPAWEAALLFQAANCLEDALARLAAAEGRVAAMTPLLEQVGARLGAARQTGTLNTGWHDLEAAIRAALASAEAATTRNTINKETKE